MEMIVDFPGGARVDTHFGPYTVKTDQPPMGGGSGSAPTPFATFLASIGACAGIYVLSFLQQRNLPTDGVRLVQRAYSDPMTGMVSKIDLEIQVPEGFPERYLPALIRTADLCAVKKHLQHPPEIEVTAKAVATA
ncbi:osmotically inducible protein OsmC [Ornatilinea apprima]|uniref:Osmotically inducible protein OsmC n=1 Tax=Ornatilinea apprima TaxID=1134406 RepID=A0A0P6XQZ8_9CHLR|nr:OsmC family protein [Ornatilinea apprima]KPL79247.1 osmotically inducible protein OsmC [Ornatilinea apprima]